MTAARAAGFLLVLAAIAVAVSALLPSTIFVPVDEEYRVIDLSAPAVHWAFGILTTAVHVAILGVGGARWLAGRGGPMIAGAALAIAIVNLTGALNTVFVMDSHFEPGPGLWIRLLAGLLGTTGGTLAALAARRRTVELDEPSPPPPGDGTPAG